ncbi:MAG: DUF1549 and DUF1553 domain-containing protein [Candidatus Omnitrophica bacterium]|nr:DUF1549 and DUF1553 domain-containing protein [Candidatus Omnitrophota bacterium]
MNMKKVLLIISVLFLQKILYSEVIIPYETDKWPIPETEIDRFVLIGLNKNGIEPANPCSDEVFIRRVYLDVIGTKPEPEEVKRFLDDKNPDKRKLLIDKLLDSDTFADYWSLKWCDILRVKAEFPINLWPNAVQAYHNWIRDAIKENIPYDRFARELLTSSGSNFRVPPVNFYRAVQGRTPFSIASAVALTFMGTRLENWDEKRKKDMADFFSRIAYKKTDEWKEEIVYLNPAFSEEIIAVLPDGKRVKIPQDTDPRIVFTDWLVKDDNPYFAKNIVNRIWSWLIGIGIIDPADDIRKDNPPSNPELLEYLERQLIKNHYDLKHIYRLILNSRTYQQSFIPKSAHPDGERYFAYYPVRRLEAEVLLDIFCKIGGTGEEYVSPIPEPFTFIPRYQRNILLADGSITNSFLEIFGRPSRDTGLESERNNKITDSQQMYLLNSSELWRKIQSSANLRRIPVLSKNNPEETIRNIYLFLLSRYPVEEEIEKVKGYLQKGGISLKDGVDDIAWTLINTKEFLYRH